MVLNLKTYLDRDESIWSSNNSRKVDYSFAIFMRVILIERPVYKKFNICRSEVLTNQTYSSKCY